MTGVIVVGAGPATLLLAGDDPAGLGTVLDRWGTGPAPLSPEVRP